MWRDSITLRWGVKVVWVNVSLTIAGVDRTDRANGVKGVEYLDIDIASVDKTDEADGTDGIEDLDIGIVSIFEINGAKNPDTSTADRKKADRVENPDIS